MGLDKILNKITSGLTGDSTKDIQYLKNQAEKYKKHKDAKEILRACGRLIHKFISDEEKKELERLIDSDRKDIEASIKEIRFNALKGNIKKAYKLSEALVSKMEASMMFENDTVSEYFVFDHLFEKVLYDYYNSPHKELREAPIPYGEIFYMHGNILFEMKCILEARKYLEKALRWNPASCTIAFEYIETFKAEKQWDMFFELTKEQHKYAYKPQDIARCFRNLGYYYIEVEEYLVAAVCYMLSLSYEQTPFAQSQLDYIEQVAPGTYLKVKVELLEQYEKQYGLPRGAHSDVIGLAYTYGHKALEKGELELASYFLEIFCDLIDDEDVMELLSMIQEKLAKED